jgi:hypothetical protein
VFLLIPPILAIGSPIASFLPEGSQVIDGRISLNYHIAAITAISTIGAAKGNPLLPTEAYYAIATVSASYHNFNPVKHDKFSTFD